jgi:hypothetical protein
MDDNNKNETDHKYLTTAIFQLHHGENKLIWNDDDEGRLVLDPHAKLNFHSSSSLKQQSADRHVSPLDTLC